MAVNKSLKFLLVRISLLHLVKTKIQFLIINHLFFIIATDLFIQEEHMKNIIEITA